MKIPGKPKASRLLPSVLLRILPIGAVVILAVGIFAYWQVNAIFKAELLTKMDGEAEFAAAEIDSRIDSYNRILETIGANDLVINALVDETVRNYSIRPFFQNMSFPYLPDALVGFTDYRGKLIAANRTGASTDNTPWLETVMAGNEYVDISAGKATLVVPVNYKGRPEGAIFLEFETSALVSHLAAPHFADASALLLDGELIARHSDGSDKDWSPGSVNTDWIVSAAASQTFPQLMLVLANRTERVFAPLSVLERFLAGVAVANLAVLALGLVITAVLVARPLARFARELGSVQQAHDLSHRVSTQGYTEIADVARNFNAMLERLDGAMVSNDVLLAENVERRKAEQELRDNRAEIVAIFETVADGIITIDAKGIIRTMNPAVTEIFGYQPEELIGKNVSLLMPAPYKAVHDSYLRDFRDTGAARIIDVGRELEAVRKSGDTFPLELFISRMEINGETRFVGVVRDITERVKVDRMKREFISVVSHELRTPLTALLGSLGLVNSGSFGELPSKVQGLMRLAENNATRLKDLVNDILDIDKLESDRIELSLDRVDLVDLVRRAHEENHPYARQFNVSFALESEDEAIAVLADDRRLSQILANLLSNAAKFSNENSIIKTEIRRIGDRVRLSVVDEGAGIPADDLEKIFNKFYQVDSTDTRSGQGTGLGLAISQQIARHHGSEIMVESTVGKGSTFYLEFSELIGDAPANAGTAHNRPRVVNG